MFYLAYYFLVRKETLFNSNRWFLLAGLFTSALLPLFFIKKIIWVERPKISMADLVAYSQQATATTKEIQAVEAFDWTQLIWFGYISIAFVLVIKIVLNLLSLYRMLHKQQMFKREGFTLVDLDDNISPFSFFKYIVYNSDFYTDAELQSIILHEQVHSKEHHSFDVLLVKLFTVVFWFNPFVWLYKKAISQNLEYIADQKAIQQLDDRQAYQHALLKVVSHQNCLSITNHFYQSLIKKRIVMLNTNQSHKRNSWKYALVIPALIGFVLLFQIKTIAQEKEESAFMEKLRNSEGIHIKIDKSSSDEDLKKEAARLKEEHGVTLKCTKIKRNTSGEITGIKVEFKDKKGNKGTTQVNGDEPIKPIHFYKNDEAIGFGEPKQVRVITNINHGKNENATNEGEPEMSYAYHFDDDSIPEIKDLNFDFDINTDGADRIASNDGNSKIIIKKDGKKPLVIINGKVVEGDESSLDKDELEELKNASKMNDGDSEATQIIINGKDMAKVRSEAMANAQIQIRRMGPQMKKQMEMVKIEKDRVRAEMERRKPEMEKARREIELSKPELEKAKAEMLQAKEEMLQAKAEMEKAKAELEKAKTELKKQKS